MRIGFSDLESGWRAIVREKWLILGCAATVAGVSALTQALLAPSVGVGGPVVLFGIALLFGGAVVYLRSARRSERLETDRVADELPEAPLLGHLPVLPDKRMTAAPGGIVQEAGYAEAMRAVAAKFTADTTRANSLIVVTSVSDGEGKSTTALNLAASLARNARVMLVDADLRDAGLSRLVGLPRYDAGLSDLIARRAPYRSCLALTGVPNLHIIRTGSLPEQPHEVLQSTRFSKTMQLSTRHYDHIVIDSPSLEAYSDATLLAADADAVILVADARAGQFSRIREELNKLKRVNARCAGIVFNRVIRL